MRVLRDGRTGGLPRLLCAGGLGGVTEAERAKTAHCRAHGGRLRQGVEACRAVIVSMRDLTPPPPPALSALAGSSAVQCHLVHRLLPRL